MATRLYLTSNAAPVTPASGTYTGGTTQAWETPASPPTALKLARPGNWPGATAFATAQATKNGTANTDSCILRFVSDPIVGAQTISGTLQGQMRMRESASTFNAHPQIILKVVSGDGTTLRGVLYAGDSRTTTVDELSTTLQNASNPGWLISPVSLTSVSAQDGDRILAEIGYRGNSTSTTATCELRYGSAAVAGGANDLSIDGTEATDLNPWIEVSQNINFDQPAGDIDIVAAAQVQPVPVTRKPGAIAVSGPQGIVLPAGITRKPGVAALSAPKGLVSATGEVQDLSNIFPVEGQGILTTRTKLSPTGQIRREYDIDAGNDDITTDTTAIYGTDVSLWVYRGNSYIGVVHLRWDTSDIPDDAIILLAQLRVHVQNKNASGGRSVIGDWRVHVGSYGTDHTTAAGSGTAFAGVANSSLPSSGYHTFTLLNPDTNVSRSGDTGVRLTMSGSGITGSIDEWEIGALEHATLDPPRLIVVFMSPGYLVEQGAAIMNAAKAIVVPSGRIAVIGSTAIQGQATVAATGTVGGEADITGSSTATIAGVTRKQGAATISGDATQAVMGHAIKRGQVVLPTATSATIAGVTAKRAAVSISGHASLTASSGSSIVDTLTPDEIRALINLMGQLEDNWLVRSA